MSPKLVKKKEKKREIGFAALNLFAEKGFSNTSMRQIADSAAVGKGTVYEYFLSKEDLIGFCLELYVEKIESVAVSRLDNIENPRNRIRQYSFEVQKTILNDPDTMGILLAVIQMLISENGESTRLKQFRKIFETARHNIISMIMEGVSMGVFRKESALEAETISNNLIAYLDGIWLHSIINPEGMDLQIQINRYLDNLFSSIDAP